MELINLIYSMMVESACSTMDYEADLHTLEAKREYDGDGGEAMVTSKVSYFTDSKSNRRSQINVCTILWNCIGVREIFLG
jgi:hypothetical protein